MHSLNNSKYLMALTLQCRGLVLRPCRLHGRSLLQQREFLACARQQVSSLACASNKLRLHSKILCAAAADVHTDQRPVAGTTSRVLEKMSWQGRDRGCGTLREEDVGSSYTLCGWVHRQRNLGGKFTHCGRIEFGPILLHIIAGMVTESLCAGVCFTDLRDSTGIVQASG
jgi:hypothetical protein